MKILWFSNCSLTSGSSKTSGTWLFSMAESLVASGVELYNITQAAKNEIRKHEGNGIVEYLLPFYSLSNGLPSSDNIESILAIVKEVTPSIIHIWGTESYFGLLAARGYLKGNVILEIQGLKDTCAPVFYGGLTPWEIYECIGLRELIRPSLSLPIKKRLFAKWGEYEDEMVKGITNVATQSDWIRGWVSLHKKNDTKRNVYYSLISVRDAFSNATKWAKPLNDAPVLLTMSASSEAYKGLHFAIRALAVLKVHYPNITLRIIGYFGENNAIYKRPGYTNFIIKLIKKLGVEKNVVFVGQKDAVGIVDEMKQADCFLQTSFVESYSLALAEAMMFGIPCVVSYAGAMPELAEPEKDALFYSPMDYSTCANQVKRILENKDLSKMLSGNSIERGMCRNTKELALKRQLEIYEKVLGA